MTAAFYAWVSRARAVPIETEVARRGLELNGKTDRCGPCPVCGGQDRFSINLKKGVWNCRGCDRGGDVIDLVQHLDGVDFVVACERLAGEPRPNGKDQAAKSSAIVVAQFPYEDENGTLVFVVERVEYRNADGTHVLNKDGKRKKSFHQKRPDPERPGAWVWNVNGVPPLLYGLPALLQAIASERTVVVVEGEGKAELLWSWNVAATCCAQGAKGWKGEHAQFLRGAEVVILPDNDTAGHKHADAVASSLRQIAVSVRVLDLPSLPPKGDVIDWAAAGNTVERFWQLVETAPNWTAVAAPQEIPARQNSRTKQATPTSLQCEDFYAYMPQHLYICAPSRDLWPAASVNARLPPMIDPDGKPIKPATWLDAYAAVDQMTWAPGEPMLVENRLVSDGGWVEKSGWTVFNLYRPPTLVPHPGDVGPWLDLVNKIFPSEADHIVLWLAQRVQRPNEKINHALVLGGKPGIGKDTILEPVKQAVGPWNFTDISPKQALGRFNGFLKSVILRVNEARDLGESDRYAFYDHMKAFIAAPPDVIRVDEKNIREYPVPNLTGVILTTNHKTNGIYLPADDRRHFVAWSHLTQDDFAADYWRTLYRWYGNGGNGAVAEFLASRELSGFDPKAPPPKTGAFWEITNANRAPEDSELADVLDDLGRPDIVTLDQVTSRASLLQPAFAEWLRDSKVNARRIPYRFEDCGYVAVRNPKDGEGRWKISGKRHTIYGKATLTENERLAAALEYTGAR